MNYQTPKIAITAGLLLASLWAGSALAAQAVAGINTLVQAPQANVFATHAKASGQDCKLKPGAGVSLAGREFVGVELGEIKTLDIDFAVTETTGQLHISLEPGQGLELLSNQKAIDFDLSQNPSLTLPIQVRVTEAGNKVLNIFASITSSQGQTSSRAMALVVQAGGSSLVDGPRKGGSPLPADMAAVIVLPAAEVIH